MMMIGAVVGGIFFMLLLSKFINYSGNKTKLPPTPSGAWPVIGHLPLLGGEKHIAHTFAKLADKYGPIFSLRLGMQQIVVVSSREAVVECFTTNDKAFANRPKSSAGEHLVYDSASFGFSNGTYWREMRKFVALEVLSARRLEAMKNLRLSEISTSIKELYNEISFAQAGSTTTLQGKQMSQPPKVAICHWIEQVALNIIVKTIAGKRYGNDAKGRAEAREVESFRKLIREFTFLSGEFVLYDVIPFPLFKWMDPQGHIKSMKRVSKELDIIIEKWIDEHMERMKKGEVGEEKDFLDVMLSTIDDNFMDGSCDAPPKQTIIKATVVNVILGGFDTTSVYLTWTLSLLVNHNHVMKKAQEEIDDKIGHQRWVEESDVKNLPYLQAIIKETLRMYPPLPLSIPHEAVEDCRLSGEYLIPKGTLLFVNLRKLHRDPKFWPEPDKFMPERFLTGHHAAHVDVFGKQFEFLPFGAGRRSCPGTTFAMQVASLTVARLLQGFDVVAPANETVDMDEGIGITMPRVNPLEVVITPRLPSHLYQN